MTRRSSAFSEDLAGLDALQALPLATPSVLPVLTLPSPAPNTQSGQDKSVARPKRTRVMASTPPSRGTRATQVRVPPHLAAWLNQQAHASGRTLGTVIALAAKAHAEMLPLQDEQVANELDVRRRSASGNVPVTLRLTSAQRQLLDNIAAAYHVTRSAVVVAALTAASGGDLN